MAAEFLQHNYDRFFTMYTQLLRSENYVTRRQSLKLLSDILVDRVHYATMIRYVSDEENLKSTMNALRDRSKNIQLEAFHVFKVRRQATSYRRFLWPIRKRHPPSKRFYGEIVIGF